MEQYEYRVTVLTNGERLSRYYFADGPKEALKMAEASLIKSVGYRQEVLSAEFTGKRMVDGIVR